LTEAKEVEYIVVFITVADEEEAGLISRVLLKQRKAACVNIIPAVKSLFRWREKIDPTQESLLIIKTRFVLLEEVTQLVKEIHSYEVPEIIALPVIGGNQDYLEWIGKETS
jgi:periplasmic divalent cation tolerance protein